MKQGLLLAAAELVQALQGSSSFSSCSSTYTGPYTNCPKYLCSVICIGWQQWRRCWEPVLNGQQDIFALPHYTAILTECLQQTRGIPRLGRPPNTAQLMKLTLAFLQLHHKAGHMTHC